MSREHPRRKAKNRAARMRDRANFFQGDVDCKSLLGSSRTKNVRAFRWGVGVSKVGGIFVHKSGDRRIFEKSTSQLREKAMKQALSAEQEAQAQELAAAIAELAQDDLLEVARTLVATTNATLFGETEFTIRDISHRVAAKAYEKHLDQKTLGWQT
jgi:hypothetical protein